MSFFYQAARWFLNVAGETVVAGVFITPVLSVFGSFLPSYMPFVGTPQLPEPPVAIGGLACSQPYNPEQWEVKQGALDFDGSVYAVATGSPNGLLYFHATTSLESDVKVSFTTQSVSQMNFIISMHDVYELTVGDGDYRRASVKMWKGGKLTPIKDVQGREYVPFSDGQVEPGLDMEVVLTQRVSLLEDGTYVLNLQLKRGSFLEPNKQATTTFATYQLPLSARFKYKNDSPWFSVGWKAASDDSRVGGAIWCVDFQ